jgi:hypothetical protein
MTGIVRGRCEEVVKKEWGDDKQKQEGTANDAD